MVDLSFNDSITDGLGDNLLSLLDTLQAKLLHDVVERDLGVRDIDFLETKLDDGVLEAHDEGEHLIRLEYSLVLLHQLLELVHVSLLNGVHDLEVWVERLLEVCL